MSKMKVLLLASHYPPNNNTAANRINSWTEYLPKEKMYPVVITWDWERESGEVNINKCDGYEVHYVPRGNNRFNQLLNKSLVSNSLFKNPLLFIQLLFANTVAYFSNSGRLQKYCSKFLDENNVDVLVSSGSPFFFHVIATRQKKRNSFYHIADYRDPWSNNEHTYKDNFAFTIVKWIDTLIERRVSKKYDFLLAASNYQRKQICNHIGFSESKSDTMLNGFVNSRYSANRINSNKHLQILFSGMFYLTQPIEKILEVFNMKLNDGSLPDTTKIIFLGTASSLAVTNRVRNAIGGYEKFYDITPRIEHSKAMEIQLNADLLVMPSHVGMKGIPSSKLFDYISTGVPVLLYPNDGDIIEEILSETNLGLICNTKEDISTYLDQLVKAKKEGVSLVLPKLDSIDQYSRRAQTKVLEQTIEKLMKPTKE